VKSSISQLLTEAGLGDLVGDLVAYMCTLGDQYTCNVLSSHDDNTTYVAIIIQTVENLMAAISDQPWPIYGEATTKSDRKASLLIGTATHVYVAWKEVLAVVLGNVAFSLEFPIPVIRNAIVKGEFGHIRVTEDLLQKFNAKVVHREWDSRHRKSDEFYQIQSVVQLNAGNMLADCSYT
jgi:hypothetical protein